MSVEGFAILEKLERPRAIAGRPLLFLVFGLGFVAAGLPYVAPVLDDAGLAWFGAYLAEALVIAPTVALLLERALRSRRRVERAFWAHWAFGMSAWLAVWILYPFFDHRWSEVGVSIVVELLYVLWYGSMFAAAIQFDETRDSGLRERLQRVEKMGLVVVGSCLMATFIIVPQLVAPEESLALVPSYLVYQLLDGALLLVYGALWWRTRDGRWRRTLLLLTGGLLAWGILDLLEAWLQVTEHVSVARSVINVFWLAPYPFLAAAIWSDARPGDTDGTAPARDADGLAAERTGVTPQQAAALLALAHLAAGIGGIFPVEALPPRSAITAAGIVVLLGLGWEHRRLVERHRRRLADELLRAQKLSAISSLAGGLAHDLRNLTTVIAGNCDLLEDSLEDRPESREQIGSIRQAALETHELVQRLLTLGRRQEAREEQIDLNAVVVRTCGSLKRLVARHADLELDLEPVLPPVVGEAGRLEQVILNLVLNARDAVGERGRIRVRTALRPAGRFTDGTIRPRDEVELCVLDDGTGIDASLRDVIFEPYFTTKAAGKGTGLGLSTVQTIVGEHGGRVEVEEAPGGGALFRVLLPARS